MKKYTYIYLAIIMALGSSCSESLKPGPYMHWLSDKSHKLIVEQKVKDFIFGLQYKTIEYMTLIDQGSNVNKNQFNEKEKGFNGLEYYTLRIGSADESSDVMTYKIAGDDHYQKRLQYFSSGIEKDIKLVCGKDSFPCTLFLFERTFKMSSYQNFQLAFDLNGKNEKSSDRTIVFKDKNLGTGTVSLTIASQSIQNIPHLTL